MSLSDQDLEKIGKIVDEKINTAIDTKVSVMIQSVVTKEIGFLRLEMNQRFDKTDEKIGKAETEIKNSLDEIKQIILERRLRYKNNLKV